MTNTQCVSITIINDVILESDEFFLVEINSTDINVIVTESIASVLILDDDGNYFNVTSILIK